MLALNTKTQPTSTYQDWTTTRLDKQSGWFNRSEFSDSDISCHLSHLSNKLTNNIHYNVLFYRRETVWPTGLNWTQRVNSQRHVTIKPGTFLVQMKWNNPSVDTIIWQGLLLCSFSAGLITLIALASGTTSQPPLSQSWWKACPSLWATMILFMAS